MSDKPILFSAPMVRALLAGTKTQTRLVIKGVPPQPVANCHPKHQPTHPAAYLDAYCGEQKTPINPRGMSENWCWWQVDDRQCLPCFKVGAKPGDRLYVREWIERAGYGGEAVGYPADGSWLPNTPWRWSRSGIASPRDLSRITLTVTDVRVQRLQDISEADAIAEGATSRPHCSGFRGMYDGWSMDWSRVGELSRFAKEGGRLSENDVSLGSAVTAFASFINETDDPRWNLKGDGLWAKNPWVAAYTFTVALGNIDQIARAA